VSFAVLDGADTAAGADVGHEPSGVRVCDGVVVGVGVAAHVAGVCGVEDGVGCQEPAGGGVVLAGADDGEAGVGVVGFAEEAVVVGPGGGRGAAGGAVGGFLPPDGVGGGVVEDEYAGALLVGEFEPVVCPGAGAYSGAAVGQADEPGAGDGAGGGVEDELLAEDEQGGLAGVFLQQQVAVGVVDVAGGASAGGVAFEQAVEFLSGVKQLGA
jgi:hypothetical protein